MKGIAIDHKIFMPPARKVQPGHLVIGLFTFLSIRLFDILSHISHQVQYLSFGCDTVTRLAL